MSSDFDQIVVLERLSQALGFQVEPVTFGGVLGLIEGLASDGRELVIHVHSGQVLVKLRARRLSTKNAAPKIFTGPSLAACLVALVSDRRP